MYLGIGHLFLTGNRVTNVKAMNGGYCGFGEKKI